MADLLVRGGRIIDVARGSDLTGDLLVEDGRVAAVSQAIRLDSTDRLSVIDAAGLIVVPGFVDVHSHLRDPGQEHKETIATGARAAAAGGFTTICAMANTTPPIDSVAGLEYVHRTAKATAAVRVRQVACISRGMAGKRLVDMTELAEAGAVAFSDDGMPVMNSELMRRALEYAKLTGLPISPHCEDSHLTSGGLMHEGKVSWQLGLKGWPAVGEEAMVARDLLLSLQTGGRLHLCHVTTARGVELVRWAKDQGAPVSAEVMPHHLTMTDDWVAGQRWDGQVAAPYDTATKVNPPLRSEEDRRALVEGLKDGTLDLIATDHAPHASPDKLCEYGLAAFGISGFETALSALLRLVHTGELDIRLVVSRMTTDPARVYGLPAGRLAVGDEGDVAIIDPSAQWTLDESKMYSKGKNTPLVGQRLVGKVLATAVAGKVVHTDEKLVKRSLVGAET